MQSVPERASRFVSRPGRVQRPVPPDGQFAFLRGPSRLLAHGDSGDCDASASYHPASAELAQQRTLDFLRTHGVTWSSPLANL